MEAQEIKKPIFSVKNVTMDFKVARKGFLAKKSTIRALNDISFDLYPGEALAIVGESVVVSLQFVELP